MTNPWEDHINLIFENDQRNLPQTDEQVAERSGTDALFSTGRTIYRVVNLLSKVVRDISPAEQPGPISIQFGVKITEQGDAIVVRSGSEAHFAVTIQSDTGVQVRPISELPTASPIPANQFDIDYRGVGFTEAFARMFTSLATTRTVEELGMLTLITSKSLTGDDLSAFEAQLNWLAAAVYEDILSPHLTVAQLIEPKHVLNIQSFRHTNSTEILLIVADVLRQSPYSDLMINLLASIIWDATKSFTNQLRGLRASRSENGIQLLPDSVDVPFRVSKIQRVAREYVEEVITTENYFGIRAGRIIWGVEQRKRLVDGSIEAS